jgi:RNA polymerase sigma-70 factor (family 1)
VLISSGNEKDILVKAAEGNEAAFRILFDKYHQKIYSFAFHLTRSRFLAEEITQEVFLKIWLKRQDLAGINFFYSYLKVVCRNVGLNYLDRIAREKLILKYIELNSADADHSTVNTVLSNEYQQILDDVIDRLPEQQRKVFLLSRQDGLKYDEIAAQLHISRHTVNEYMKKALLFIRNQLHRQLNLSLLYLLWWFF